MFNTFKNLVQELETSVAQNLQQQRSASQPSTPRPSASPRLPRSPELSPTPNGPQSASQLAESALTGLRRNFNKVTRNSLDVARPGVEKAPRSSFESQESDVQGIIQNDNPSESVGSEMSTSKDSTFSNLSEVTEPSMQGATLKSATTIPEIILPKASLELSTEGESTAFTLGSEVATPERSSTPAPVAISSEVMIPKLPREPHNVPLPSSPPSKLPGTDLKDDTESIPYADEAEDEGQSSVSDSSRSVVFAKLKSPGHDRTTSLDHTPPSSKLSFAP